jgi:hypothetical protein
VRARPASSLTDDGEAANRAGIVFVKAETKCGRELAATPRAKGVVGRDKKGQTRGSKGVPRVEEAPTLAEIGLDRKRAARAQKLALIPIEQQTGEDQTAFILSRNMARRYLTKGQLAIVAAKVQPKARTASERGAMKGKSSLISKELFPMVNEGALSQARVIVEYEPLLADDVLGGTG